MKIVYQRNGIATYKGTRIYIDSEMLAKAGYNPEERFDTDTKPEKNEIIFTLNKFGKNKVSHKKKNKKVIPVIDKAGKEIREALDLCDNITISIIELNGTHQVLVKGEKKTATVQREKNSFSESLRTITFCAGAGISSEAMKQVGFEEIAAVEWNPKEGSEDKFARLYAENNPESIVFNMPMEQLKAEHLPDAEVWLCTLDCTDYSKSSNGTNKGLHTMHLFMHLMRLFWEKPKDQRPIAVLVENVPEFEKVAGNSLELCFKEEGFFVSKTQLNSIEFGSRTQRKRFFMMATLFEGFEFPQGSGIKQSSILSDGTLSLNDLEWVTPEDSKTLKYFLERQKGKMTHNHVMTVFDLTKDAYIGTITKSHHKIQPENWIRHPYKENTYAYLKAEQIRAIQGIPSYLQLGESNKLQIESMGQSVCYVSFKKIANTVYNFLSKAIARLRPSFSQFEQLSFGI